eukprot:scaffold7056_cov245-Pinguiococcus_pyrenoidosus.AAC.2
MQMFVSRSVEISRAMAQAILAESLEKPLRVEQVPTHHTFINPIYLTFNRYGHSIPVSNALRRPLPSLNTFSVDAAHLQEVLRRPRSHIAVIVLRAIAFAHNRSFPTDAVVERVSLVGVNDKLHPTLGQAQPLQHLIPHVQVFNLLQGNLPRLGAPRIVLVVPLHEPLLLVHQEVHAVAEHLALLESRHLGQVAAVVVHKARAREQALQHQHPAVRVHVQQLEAPDARLAVPTHVALEPVLRQAREVRGRHIAFCALARKFSTAGRLVESPLNFRGVLEQQHPKSLGQHAGKSRVYAGVASPSSSPRTRRASDATPKRCPAAAASAASPTPWWNPSAQPPKRTETSARKGHRPVRDWCLSATGSSAPHSPASAARPSPHRTRHRRWHPATPAARERAACGSTHEWRHSKLRMETAARHSVGARTRASGASRTLSCAVALSRDARDTGGGEATLRRGWRARAFQRERSYTRSLPQSADPHFDSVSR